ncbi:MAG TPA: hypothetical protein VII63_13350 [Caulobacteraceae bacterium]
MKDERRAEILRMLERHPKKALASPAAARASLMKTGIYTKDGKLSPDYGGDKTDPA